MCAAHSSAQAQPAVQPRAPPPAPRREAPQVARSPPASSATNHQQGALGLDNGPAVASQPPAAGPPSQPAAMPPQPSGAAVVRLGRTPVPHNIPNLGGRRPKQNQAVRTAGRSAWVTAPSRACCASRSDTSCAPAQTSMSGISVSEDAINMYYFMKAKSTVGTRGFVLQRPTVSLAGWLAGSADSLAAPRSTDGRHG